MISTLYLWEFGLRDVFGGLSQGQKPSDILKGEINRRIGKVAKLPSSNTGGSTIRTSGNYKHTQSNTTSPGVSKYTEPQWRHARDVKVADRHVPVKTIDTDNTRIGQRYIPHMTVDNPKTAKFKFPSIHKRIGTEG